MATRQNCPQRVCLLIVRYVRHFGKFSSRRTVSAGLIIWGHFCLAFCVDIDEAHGILWPQILAPNPGPPKSHVFEEAHGVKPSPNTPGTVVLTSGHI